MSALQERPAFAWQHTVLEQATVSLEPVCNYSMFRFASGLPLSWAICKMYIWPINKVEAPSPRLEEMEARGGAVWRQDGNRFVLCGSLSSQRSQASAETCSLLIVDQALLLRMSVLN